MAGLAGFLVAEYVSGGEAAATLWLSLIVLIWIAYVFVGWAFQLLAGPR